MAVAKQGVEFRSMTKVYVFVQISNIHDMRRSSGSIHRIDQEYFYLRPGKRGSFSESFRNRSGGITNEKLTIDSIMGLEFRISHGGRSIWTSPDSGGVSVFVICAGFGEIGIFSNSPFDQSGSIERPHPTMVAIRRNPWPPSHRRNGVVIRVGIILKDQSRLP